MRRGSVLFAPLFIWNFLYEAINLIIKYKVKWSLLFLARCHWSCYRPELSDRYIFRFSATMCRRVSNCLYKKWRLSKINKNFVNQLFFIIFCYASTHISSKNFKRYIVCIVDNALRSSGLGGWLVSRRPRFESRPPRRPRQSLRAPFGRVA